MSRRNHVLSRPCPFPIGRFARRARPAPGGVPLVESSYRVEFSVSPSRPFAFYYLQPYGVPIASRAPSLSPAAALELPPASAPRLSLTSTLH